MYTKVYMLTLVIKNIVYSSPIVESHSLSNPYTSHTNTYDKVY